MHMNDAIIARLAARQEIEGALANYSIGIDDRDPARWLSAFHTDAVFDVDFPKAVLKGHEAILNWAHDPWRFQAITHLTGNHRIDFSDDLNAQGIGHGIGIFKLEDGTTILATARLEDNYQRQEGAWKISRRKVAIVSSFVLTDAQAVMLNGTEVSPVLSR
jgi:gamma-hexachlorocyclohexane dehydrochlorinase